MDLKCADVKDFAKDASEVLFAERIVAGGMPVTANPFTNTPDKMSSERK
jgi:hypothetical protein